MSVYSGPEIANDGLVFSYDISNNQKSWIGKPTVNYIVNPTEEMPRGEFGQYRDLAPTFDTYGLVPYSLSMDIKVNKPGSVLVYMQNGSSTKYGFVGDNVNATIEYQRFYFNNITPSISTPSDTAATLATYTGYGSGVTPTIKNIQLELGSFATPFVNGTRSNTQAVRDLTSNNTITANSLTYTSDGTFSFNGSNSYIDSGTNIPNTSAFTIECFVQPANSQVQYSGIMGNHGSGGGVYCQQQSTSLNNYVWGYGNGSSWGTGCAFSLTSNVWHHLVLVKDSSYNSVYINGVLSNYVTSNGLAALGPFNICFGRDYSDSRYFNGNISSGKIYNRALSASEVQQNFNATRSRYGI
jgi:hypothetical protein